MKEQYRWSISQIEIKQINNILGLQENYFQCFYKEQKQMQCFLFSYTQHEIKLVRQNWNQFLNEILKSQFINKQWGQNIQNLINRNNKQLVQHELLEEQNRVQGIVRKLIKLYQEQLNFEQNEKSLQIEIENKFLQILELSKLNKDLIKHFKKDFEQSNLREILGFEGGIYKFNQDLKNLYSYQSGKQALISLNKQTIALCLVNNNLDNSVSETSILNQDQELKIKKKKYLKNNINMFIFRTVMSIIELQMNNPESILYLLVKWLRVSVKKECEMINSLDLKVSQLQSILDELYSKMKQFLEVLSLIIIYFYNLDQLTIKYKKYELLFNFENIYNWTLRVLIDNELYCCLLQLQKIVDQNQAILISQVHNQFYLTTPQYFDIRPELTLDSFCLKHIHNNIDQNKCIQIQTNFNQQQQQLFVTSSNREQKKMDEEIDLFRDEQQIQQRNNSVHNTNKDYFQKKPYFEAIQELNKIEEIFNPIEQLKQMVIVEDQIIQCINTFYQQNNCQYKQNLSADQMTPIFIYVISQSYLTSLPSQIHIIVQLSQQSLMHSHCGYILFNLQACLNYLIDIYQKKTQKTISTHNLLQSKTLDCNY